jgi:polyisoprenoid-binding protein YceI
MKRSLLLSVAGVAVVVAAAAFYLFWFAGGSGEPSTELTTPELAATSTTAGDPGDTDTTDTTQSEGSSPQSYIIDPAQSTARFEIDEVLNGNPQHVVGTTDQVAGQVRVDAGDVSTAEFSEVVVNARTLATDSDRRDRAIRGPVILDSGSDEHELITFSVTAVEGLEGPLTVGESIEFSLTGALLVKGTAQSVTFEASITMVDEVTIEGSATAEISRDMFGIGIPSVPSVADVTNEVLIGLDFVAVAG